MNPKPNPTRKKQDWQAARRLYTWHLRPAFRSIFDSAHWWEEKESKSLITAGSALYELVRRHPMVRETWLRSLIASDRGDGRDVPRFPNNRTRLIANNERGFLVNHPPPSLAWTCFLGLKPWSKLDDTDRMNWQGCVGNLKGLDFRDESAKGRAIIPDAYGIIFDKRRQILASKATTLAEIKSLVKKDFITNPPTVEEWEAAIAQSAVQAHRFGFVLLAVVPDLAKNELLSAVSSSYRERLPGSPLVKPKQRARWQDWLPLISKFERGEKNFTAAYAQDFARYRRVLDKVRFK